MSDQIILEFIGDPSGLRPAEDALKGLSKTSQETIESFSRANEAAKKFADTAREAAASLRGIDDAAGKTVKAISSLTQSISGGAVRAIITDFKNWSAEIVTLTAQKEKLQAKLAAAQAEMARLKTELKDAAKEYTTLTREAGSLEAQITRTGNAIAFHAAEAAKAVDKNETLKTKLAATQRELAAMTGTADQGGDKFQKLTSTAQKLESQIEKNNAAYATHAAKTLELGEKNESLKSNLADVKTEMLNVNTKITEGKEQYAELGKETKTLQGSISDTTQAITASSAEFAQHSRAAKDSTQSIGSLVANTKKLITSMGEIGAAMAQSTGHEAEANAIRQKTAEVLSVITTAQAVATAATDAMTAATEIATGAAIGLDVALAPVIVVMLAIAAAVASVVGGFKLFQFLADTVKPVGDAVKFVEDKTRDLLNLLTFGFIDNSAIHQHKEDLKNIGDQHTQNSESIKKQIDLLEAQGASSERIATRRREQLIEEKKALEANLELEKDAAKQKELQNKLDENQISLLKNKKEIADAHLTTLRAEGATDLQILQYQQQQTAEEIKLNNAAIDALKNQIRFFEIVHMGTDALKQDLLNLQSIHDVLTGKQLDQTKQIAKEQKKQFTDIEEEKHTARLKELEDNRAILDKKLIETKANSIEQLNAKIAALEASAKVEIENAKDNQAKISLINAKLIQDTREAQKEFTVSQNNETQKRLQNQKTGLEAQLVLAKQGSAEELKLKQQLFDKEREMIKANIILTENEKAKALNEVSKTEQNYIQQLDKQELDNKIAAIDQQLAAEKQFSAKAVQLAKDRLVEIMQMEKDKATATITDKNELTATLRQIDARYIKDKQKLEDDASKENKKKEADAAKEKEALARQIGAKLVEIAKEVSDAVFENEKQKRENDLKAHLDSLNDQKSAELLNTTLTASQRRAIEKKYKIEEAQEKERAWKADQKAKAEQALINGLLALTMCLAQQAYPAGLITGLLALAQAGVQAGIIMSKAPPKFAKGVVALDGPGTSTSDSIPAYLSRGESVITADATSKFKPMLEAMNAGTFSSYMPIPQIPDVSKQLVHTPSGNTSHAQIDYDKLSEAFARKINMKQLHINIDEKGFTKSIISKGNRIESYNDKMKF